MTPNRLLYAAFAALTWLVTPVLAADRFTIAVIPDTQNYIDFHHQKAEGYPFDAREIFFEQMRYIAAHAESNGGDIVFAVGLGDIWQNAILEMDPEHAARGFKRIDSLYGGGHLAPDKVRAVEIPAAVEGYGFIAGKLPFAVVPGNHDYDASWLDPRFPSTKPFKDKSSLGLSFAGGLTGFVGAFGADTPFFKDQSWYVAAHDGGADSAQIFTAGGMRFLHIGLQFDPTNAALEWAAGVMARFPGVPTIVTTHNYLDPSNERLAGPYLDNHAIDPERSNSPQLVWEKFISRHDQIFLVLCGHRVTNGLRIEENQAGHKVYQVLSDYQDRHQAAIDAKLDPPGALGDGWMRLMAFDMTGAVPTIRVRTYSTHYKKVSTELPTYAAWYKYERPTLSDADFHATDDFTLTLEDFRQRFGNAMGSKRD